MAKFNPLTTPCSWEIKCTNVNEIEPSDVMLICKDCFPMGHMVLTDDTVKLDLPYTSKHDTMAERLSMLNGHIQISRWNPNLTTEERPKINAIYARLEQLKRKNRIDDDINDSQPKAKKSNSYRGGSFGGR